MSYAYDNASNLLTRTDGRGYVTTYGGYDALNRPTTITYSDGTPTVTLGYDAVANSTGQLTSISNSNSATTYAAFDALGRVTASSQQTNGLTFGFTYTYNLAGALTSETYPSGRVVTTGYDGANRTATLSGNLNGARTGYITQTAYLSNGGIKNLARGNTLWYLEGYNSRQQLTSAVEELNNNSSQQLWNLGLTWVNASGKNNGTLQGTTTVGGGLTITQSYGYDSLNRLTSASETGSWAQGYSYDQYGNMWMPTSSLGAPPVGPGAPTANVYNAKNQNANSSYDLAGNLKVFGSVAVAYDAENRQKTAGSNSYVYDGAGQRVGKTTPSGTTTFVYDAFGQLAAEYSTAAVTNLCTTCYLSTDHLGSTRMITDGSGNVVARHDYAPFGQEILAGVNGRTSLWGASDLVNAKFTGYARDTETALDFAQARYMSAGLGRFMSPDPANAGADFTNPQSWNGYAYVLGNPLGYRDPSGLCTNGNPDQDGDVLTDSVTLDSGGNIVGQSFGCATAVPTAASPTNLPTSLQYADPSSGNSGPSQVISSGDPDPSTYDVPIDDAWGQSLALVGQNVDAQNAFLGKFAVSAVSVGATLGTAGIGGQALNQLALGPATGRAVFNGAFGTAAQSATAIGARVLGGPGSGIGAFYRGSLAPLLPPGLQGLGWTLLSRAWASGAAGTVPLLAQRFTPAGGHLFLDEAPILFENSKVFLQRSLSFWWLL